jgi:hypothetical protein
MLKPQQIMKPVGPKGEGDYFNTSFYKSLLSLQYSIEISIFSIRRKLFVSRAVTEISPKVLRESLK